MRRNAALRVPLDRWLSTQACQIKLVQETVAKSNISYSSLSNMHPLKYETYGVQNKGNFWSCTIW